MAEGLNGRTDIRAVPEHLASLEERAAYRTDFARALLLYTGYLPRTGRTGLRDGRRAAMRRALEGRASYYQIRDWCQGWRPVPQWAKALLAEKLEARARAAQEARARLA